MNGDLFDQVCFTVAATLTLVAFIYVVATILWCFEDRSKDDESGDAD